MPRRPKQNGFLETMGRSLWRPRLLLAALSLVILAFAALALTGCGPDTRELTEQAVALMGSGRFDEALPIQEQIAALDPADAQIRVELGFNYLNHQDDPARAVAIFKEAVALEPSAKFMTFLAQAYLAAGDSASAEATLRQAIEKDKSYGHSYLLLISLLEKAGRAAEAEDLHQAAETAGITMAPDEGK